MSDSASNGTGTPPPPPSSTPTMTVTNVKTIKTGKIYKPKFHTALQCVNNDIETSSLSSTSSTNSSSSTIVITMPKPNPEQVQEHIDKIITDNQAIVVAVDPRLHKLVQRQQSLVETKQSVDQPLNLSSAKESSRKRCYSESFVQENKDCPNDSEGNSIIKDLLLKNQNSCQERTAENENYFCPSCDIPYSGIDVLDVHHRYYWNGSASPRREYQLEIEKGESDFDSKSSDYYNNLQPLPSPGPLLGNTRLVDTYVPPVKKQRPESVPTTLRSLEELSKYPRPNSLQMFGGEVRILDNTGETKTMRIEPRQTNSPTNEQAVNSKCVTSETASIVVRSGLHSGGTMVYKPPGTPVSIPSSSISLPNMPKMLAPIIPNISTPNMPNIPSVDLIAKTDKVEAKLAKNDVPLKEETKPNKFLRPTSLPLKPGTFTPKKHHGITPTANTLPLISPETPRPKKSYGQLYLNGHAYTYLGLKCSTRVFYCTLNRPQPMYVTQQHGLSMYSNWEICKEAPPDVDMAHYDSRHRPLNYTTAWKKQEDILTHSSHRPTTPTSSDSDMQDKAKRVKIFDGGFESNEDYTYVRGRGKGMEIILFAFVYGLTCNNVLIFYSNNNFNNYCKYSQMKLTI